MSFKKVADGIYSGIPADVPKRQIHKSVSNGKQIFYFGTNEITNPKSNTINYECFRGGYLVSFQNPGWKYRHLSEIMELDHLHDVIFNIEDRLYMIIYSRHDPFEIDFLLEWSDERAEWVDSRFEIDNIMPPVIYDETDCSALICNDQRNGYFTVYGIKNDQIKVFKITKASDGHYTLINGIVNIHDVLGTSDSRLLQTCVHDETLFAFYGKCNATKTIWDSHKILSVSLSSESSKVELCHTDDGVYPNLSPRCTVQNGDQWIVITGADDEDHLLSDIWVLDLHKCQWRRSAREIPKDLDGPSLTAIQMNGVLFIADNKNGVYALNLGDI